MKTDIIINRLKDLRDKGECVSETLVLEQAIKSLEAWEFVKTEIEKEKTIKSLEAWKLAKTETEKGSNIAPTMLHRGEAIGLNKALEIIDKHLSEVNE